MKSFKQLLEDIQAGPAPEEISYKGYTTKNLHHVPDAAKAFQATITRVQKGTLQDNGEVLAALKATDTYMKLNDMHLEQEKDLDSQELDQWLAAHEEAKSALTKIGEFEHHYDYWNSHNAELQYLKANQNMSQEAESVQIEEGPYSSGQLKASPEQLKQANKAPSGGRTTTIVDRDAKGVYTLTMKDGKEVSKVYKESTEIAEELDFKKEAAKHMKDVHSSNVTQAVKQHAAKMVRRALEASRMKDKAAAHRHYMMGEEVELEEASKLQGTPVVSLSDFGSKDNTKNKYGQTVPKKLKPNDPRVKMYTEPKKEGVSEGSILKSIKRGLQGWDKNAVGPGGEKLGDPRDIVKRAKAMDTDTAKKVRAGLDAASDHSPAGLQKRVLDRKLKGVSEGLADDFLAMAKNRNPNARIVTAVQKRKETEELMKKREASGTKPAHAAPTGNSRPLGGHDPKSGRSYSESVESIDEISAELKQKYLAAATKKHLQQFLGREKVRDKQELDKRRAAIQKTSKELTGKTHYQESVELEEVMEGQLRNFSPHSDLAGRGRLSGYNKTAAGKKREADRETERLKDKMKFTKSQGGIAGPKGKLPEQVELDEAVKKKLMIGSKVSHPVHGKGMVVMHSLGGGTSGTVVKFADGKKVKVDHKKLRIEEVELEEKTLTPAELKKREEVAKAMERKNPNMDMSRKMAIATAVAKRVAEQYDDAE